MTNLQVTAKTIDTLNSINELLDSRTAFDYLPTDETTGQYEVIADAWMVS